MIVRLVSQREIQTQEELCEALHEEGFEVTQATVSRDIKELALIKITDGEKSRYSVPQLQKQALDENGGIIFKMIADSINSIDHALNTVVIKCASGMAQAVCLKIDSADIHALVGTIAGDDTIFILMRTEKDAERLCRELSMIIESRK